MTIVPHRVGVCQSTLLCSGYLRLRRTPRRVPRLSPRRDPKQGGVLRHPVRSAAPRTACVDRRSHAHPTSAPPPPRTPVPVPRAPQPVATHAAACPHAAQGRGTTRRLTTAAGTGSSPARRERRTGRSAAHRARRPDRGSDDERRQQRGERAATSTGRRSSKGTNANQTRKGEGDGASVGLLFRCFYSTRRRASCQGAEPCAERMARLRRTQIRSA